MKCNVVLPSSMIDLVKQEEELWKEEVSKKAKKRKKDLKKIKKIVDEVQGSAPELLQESDSRVMEDSQIEEVALCPERDAESVAALLKMSKVVDKSQGGKPKKKASSSHLKVVEDSQASALKRKVSLAEVEESKKAKKVKKVLKKREKKANEEQGGVSIKYDVEVPELLQESDSRVMKNLESEEVAFCPERDAESVAALSKVAKVVDNSQGGKPKKKASLSYLGSAAIKCDVEVHELLQNSEDHNVVKSQGYTESIGLMLCNRTGEIKQKGRF
ncbi:hypothetical protein C5167_029475 [Papaver somniferum]|nr:hypothetical protein C5167_029475 [Papaver somniferum]